MMHICWIAKEPLPRRYLQSLQYTFLSTRTNVPSNSADVLYGRISPVGDPGVPMAPILDQWIEEGKHVTYSQLLVIIKQLRRYRRYKHALEVSYWVTDRRLYPLSRGHVAVRVDLIARVHGLEEAEKYLNNVHKSLKRLEVDGALLNCYVRNRCIEKAEVQMQKMRVSKHYYAPSRLCYNVMLNLYSQTELEKLENLLQEMGEKNIQPDSFTLGIRLNTYASLCDIEKMEKLLAEIETEPNILTWNICITVANGYMKAGMIDKVVDTLKKAEVLSSYKDQTYAYRMLITLYTSCGKKDEVCRIWDLYKSSSFRPQNVGYICIMSSLLKMDDIDGARKILQEWESGHVHFDFRILNVFISYYCKKGMAEKAEEMVNKAVNSGNEPTPGTWDALAGCYYEANRVDEAIGAVKKAVLVSRGPWELKRVSLASCVDLLKDRGDLSGAVDLINVFRERRCISEHDYEQFMSVVNGDEGSGTSNREMNKVITSEAVDT